MTKKVKLIERNENGSVKTITAVKRENAEKWAKAANKKLDFYGNRCWIVE